MADKTNPTVWGHSQDCPAAINSDFECTCKAGTECKLGLWGWCLTHRCFIKECQPDTTTQGDDSKPFKHGQEGTHYACSEAFKPGTPFPSCCGCNGHNCVDNLLDNNKPVERESEKTRSTGDDSKKGDRGSIEGRLDDSMKEQIEKLYNRTIADSPHTQRISKGEFFTSVLALFQSQESKTLERVREKILDKFFTENGYMREDIPHEIIEDIEKVFEAEQKGSKNG